MKSKRWHGVIIIGLFAISAVILFGLGLGYFVGVDSETGYTLLTIAGIAFVLGIVALIVTATPYGVNVRGYEGILHRVLKAPGHRNEYFIQGEPETTFREVVRDIWPFDDQDVNNSWKLVTASGEDVTDRSLSSYEGIVEIVFAT
ncbi:MAG: hypothetical protein ACTSUB_02275 [Candidatus Thorarchaeota archaeon]